MSEEIDVDSPKEQETKTKKGKKNAKESSTTADKAREACANRSKRSSDTIYYYMVIGGFVVMCIACVIYVFVEWQASPNTVNAVSQESIDKHNKARGVPFQRGPNKLFTVLLLL